MQVERGLRVMNGGVIGKSYDIASYYLRKSGAIPDDVATNNVLLQTIVQIFEGGETNQLKLANRAIAEFQAAQLIG